MRKVLYYLSLAVAAIVILALYTLAVDYLHLGEILMGACLLIAYSVFKVIKLILYMLFFPNAREGEQEEEEKADCGDSSSHEPS